MHNYTVQLDELKMVVDQMRPLLSIIEEGGNLLLNALRQGSKVLTCGNGGSAADALHLAEELLGRYNRHRQSLPAICLCADASIITCISNDFGYHSVFERQLGAYAQSGDVLIGFSTSGNSENVVRAFRKANELGLVTLFLGGKDGGILKQLATRAIIIPSENTARIQEMHTFVLHSWLEHIDDFYCA
jgi:D-sedoheptulose 7-phosphate isomerase